MSTACKPAVLVMMIGPTETGDRRKVMERTLRQETQKEHEAHVLVDNVRALLLVAEQALERGMSGEEFDFTARVDLMAGINAGKAALRVVGLMKAAAVDEAAKAHREAQRATEEYIPGYCATCVRIQMAKLEGGEFIPAFKAVSSDVCDRCFGEPESI
jgi:hypothetical protein